MSGIIGRHGKKEHRKVECTHCHKPVDMVMGNLIWLERNRMDGQYYFRTPKSHLPADLADGTFPFDTACAFKVGKSFYPSRK